MEIKKHEKIIVWALDSKGNKIHISGIESGKKGYYCIGCERELVANKGNIKIHYFSHYVKNKKIEVSCYLAEETYRHRLAKLFLVEQKQLKVPTLYKYPPIGINGSPNKLRNGETIVAFRAKMEVQFYEDEHGNIHENRGDRLDTQDKRLRIVPDVVFYNEKNEPILFIEIVATHKIDEEKLAKIYGLGIDTVQITVPQGTREEIEAIFSTAERTKWVYNNERENTPYVFFPRRDGEGIPSIDEIEREFLDLSESYRCTSARIKNLIYDIRNCLESESYRTIEGNLKSEISRIESNTEREREQLSIAQRAFEGELSSEFSTKTEQLEREESEFECDRSDLGSRYQSKKGELENDTRICREEENEIDRNTREAEGVGSTPEEIGRAVTERRKQLRDEQERISRAIEAERGTFEGHEKQNRHSIRKLQESLDGEQRKINNIEQSRKGTIRNTEESIAAIGTRRISLQDIFSEKERELRAEYEAIESDIRRRFEDLRNQSLRAAQSEDYSGEPRLQSRVEDLLAAGRAIKHIEEGKDRFRLLKQIRDAIEKGYYKNWI